MLDGLMRRPVLAEPDRVVRHDVDDAEIDSADSRIEGRQ
jgi:hypothetical protein